MGSALSLSYRRLSLWHETTPTDWTPRPALEGGLDADVAIVGAGCTGLWTAYYLSVAEPSLRVVVLEAEVAGFGASGRNGGWCSALFPRSPRQAQDAAMRASVDEVHGSSPRCRTRSTCSLLRQRRFTHAGAGRSAFRGACAPSGWPPATGAGLPPAAGGGGVATRTLGATYTPLRGLILSRSSGRTGLRGDPPPRPPAERSPVRSLRWASCTPRGSVRSPTARRR